MRMLYYKISSSNPENLTKVLRTIKDGHGWVKSNGNGCLYAATGEDHTTWIEGIANQFNTHIETIDKSILTEKFKGLVPKREYKAFDGTIFTDKMLFAAYERNKNPENKAKRQQRLKERKPRSEKCEIVARLEPNQPFTFEGVINSLKVLENRLLEAYNEVADLSVKLTKISEYDKLLQDRDDYLNAAKIILKVKV